jgi:hypothetical protein
VSALSDFEHLLLLGVGGHDFGNVAATLLLVQRVKGHRETVNNKTLNSVLLMTTCKIMSHERSLFGKVFVSQGSQNEDT